MFDLQGLENERKPAEIQVFYFGEGLDKLQLLRLLIDWFC